jgi:hypothetical protein
MAVKGLHEFNLCLQRSRVLATCERNNKEYNI